MTRAMTGTDRAINAILRQQAGLISRRQALAAGLTKEAIRWRVRAGGSWRVVLPGIYLSHNSGLTSGQREIAAVLYAGDPCMLTGITALDVHGARVPRSDLVDVLVPAAVQRQSVVLAFILKRNLPAGGGQTAAWQGFSTAGRKIFQIPTSATTGPKQTDRPHNRLGRGVR